MLKNTDQQYGHVSRYLHWLLTVMVLGMLTVGILMGDLPKPFRYTIYNIHKLTGLSVLILISVFALWSLFNRKPKYPAEMKFWEKRLARTVHLSLFALIIFMPLSGWLMSTAANKLPHIGSLQFAMPDIPVSKPLSKFGKHMHEYIAWAIGILVGLHVIGALKHHFINKNNILRRMLGQ